MMRLLNSTDIALWRIALPMIFSNITVPLLGFVDTAVIGHLDNPLYLGGVAIGAMVTSFLFMLLMFLRMTTTGLSAQAYGAGNLRGLVQALVQPLWLALIVGLAIVWCSQPLIHATLFLIGGTPEVLQQASQFLSVRLLSAPAALGNLVLLGWLLGVQYVRAPVIMLIVGNVLNIILALGFVTRLGWGVQGAALATVVSEYVTLILGLTLVYKVMRKRGIAFNLLKGAWRGDLRRLMGLNRDIMLRSLLLQSCFATLTILGARLGSDIVAVNAVLMNLLTFTAYALDGFAFAVEAYSGQAYGARDDRQLIRVWKAACRQAGLIALLFALFYAVAGSIIVDALTSLEVIRQLSRQYLFWQVLLPLLGVWSYLLDGVFIGATKGREMRNSMAVAAAGYGITLLTLPVLGNHALWLALAVFLSLRGLSLGWIWHCHRRAGNWFQSVY